VRALVHTVAISPDLITQRTACSSALATMKITSMITEKLLCSTLKTTLVPTSATGAPSEMPMLEASSSPVVTCSESNEGATKGSSSASSLSRRAVARPKV
jgi:hypothetical protein